jgi:HEAT repeat protein
MDARPLEAILTEIGKGFRLCRLYPPTHPSVQQCLSELAAVLPQLASVGAVELRIGPSGFSLGTTHLAPRNLQVQELAHVLYAQGHRTLAMEPGLSADEVMALIQLAGAVGRARASTAGAPAPAALQHIRLERAARASQRTAAPTSRPSADGPALARRSTGVFRPDALPADIEARRLASQVEGAAPGDAVSAAGRLAALVPELLALREWSVLAETVLALTRTAARAESEVAAAATSALRAASTEAVVSGLLARVSDCRAPAAERDLAAHALGALGARAVPQVFDAFLVADDETRGVLAAIARRAGDAAVEPVAARLDSAPRADIARAAALLLGASASARAVPVLAGLAADRDAAVRAAAMDALERIGGQEAERALAAALRDPDATVRLRAARGVAWLGAQHIAPILLARLEEEEDHEVAAALMRALGELRETRAVAVLGKVAAGVSGLFQRHPIAVRAAALRALAAIGTEEARAIARQYAADRHAELREAARQALGAELPGA